MPRVPKLTGNTPVSVLDAVEAFGTELRIRLIRHYIDHPGSQADAVRALGSNSGVVTRNTQLLVRIGVVVEALADDERTRIYRTELRRYDELVAALHRYAHDD